MSRTLFPFGKNHFPKVGPFSPVQEGRQQAVKLVIQSRAVSFPSPMSSRATQLLFWYVVPLSENHTSPACRKLIWKVKNIEHVLSNTRNSYWLHDQLTVSLPVVPIMASKLCNNAIHKTNAVRVSVDSLCRDGTDTQYTVDVEILAGKKFGDFVWKPWY